MIKREDIENLTPEQKKLIEKYCRDEMRELKKLCKPIIYKKNIDRQYDDDIYSEAQKILLETVLSYESERGDFKTYLIGNLKRGLYDWQRDNMRGKRCNLLRDEKGRIVKDEEEKVTVIPNISFDAPAEDGLDLSEKIASNITIESSVNNDLGFKSDGRAEKYIGSLIGIQKKIAEMIVQGYDDFSYIKEQLGLSDKEFSKALDQMREYEKKKLLKRDAEISYVLKEDVKMVSTKSNEKAKNTSYSVASIVKQLNKHQLRDDHVLQRHSGQWSALTKSELISDILQGNSLTQIIISEEIKDGITKYWLIDGKQRCTNLDDFVNNGFAISKNVQVYMIKYQAEKLDENGNVMMTEDGFPITEQKEFDIRGKKFSKFPEELRDKILDYQVPVMLNLNCTKFDIAYDIARFNRCKPMNKSQIGWLGMEENFAELVDNILKMQMFQASNTTTSYTQSNVKADAMRRMIVESIMVMDFLDDYNTDFNKMCMYLSENANDATFARFYDKMERLNAILIDDVASLFNMKESFVWFAIFDKFCEVGLEDQKYVEFMTEFIQSLHTKKIKYDDKELSYDEISAKNNRKDKSQFLARFNHIMTLMYDFLGIEHDDIVDASVSDNIMAEEAKFIDSFSSTDMVFASNMSSEDVKLAAVDVLENIGNEEDALYYTEC